MLYADFLAHPWAPGAVFQSPALRLVMGLGVAPLALVVGALVLRRAPGNVTGLCLLLLAVLIMGSMLRAGSPLRPLNSALNTAWFGVWVLGLYYPDVRPHPPRLGGLVHGLSMLSLLANVAWGFAQPAFRAGTQPNPVYVPALAGLRSAIDRLQPMLLLALVLLLPLSLRLRYRVSGARGQLHLKWLGFGFGLLLAIMLPLFAAGMLQKDFATVNPAGRLAVQLLTLYIFLFPTVTVGIAILRHRLYDIDVLIRRTLVYSALTGLLALIYFGSVLVLQSLFSAIVNPKSAITVVLSTLIIAALFVPLRARVQAWIDRRFYRRKYDAARTLAEFAATARDETVLEWLGVRLVEVVREAMQPEDTSLWLASAAVHRRRTG